MKKENAITTARVERFSYVNEVAENDAKNFTSQTELTDMVDSNVHLYVTEQHKSMFNSTIGTIVSCLGSAVGTGNIWRFPRMVATYSFSKGSFSFYLAWATLLFFWSIPIILIEYSLGRFTQNSVPAVFCKFFGKYFAWVGGWLVTTVFFLSGYYPVIVGWCLYYLWVSCTASELPDSEAAGHALFNGFARDSAWPVLTQILIILITGSFIFGGIRWIERANLFLVPLLLTIVIFTFGWSLTRPYAEVGISFLLTPYWKSLAMPSVWIAAASQNAFDTGAGISVLLTYATFMTRSSQIVKYSLFIPVTNNLVSLYMSFTIFSTVFSTLITEDGTLTRSAIVNIIQDAGPGSTGLTFTWIPVLFSKVGILGRVFCALFFLCLLVAGISSLLPNIQVLVITFKELGVPHRIAVTVALVSIALAGIPSALSLEFLENQDNTWGYALIISGLLLTSIVLIYGPLRYRRIIINEFGTNDWKVPIIWVAVVSVLVPLQGTALMVWWVFDYVRSDPHWYHLSLSSITSILLEWIIVVIALITANMIAVKCKPDLYENSRERGCDPHNPLSYMPETQVEMNGVIVVNDR